MDDLGWEILQALPEPVIFVDIDQAIQFMNPAAVELFEISEIDVVIGTSFNFLLGGRGLRTYEEWIEAVKRNNEFATHPVTLPKPSDEQTWESLYKNKYFHFHAIPIYDRNKNLGYIIRVDDTTKERLAYQFLAALSSEMATPITSIKGFAEILSSAEHSANLTEEQRKKFTGYIKKYAIVLSQLRDSIGEFFSQFR